MEKEKIQSFLTRITQTSQTGLVVITYDIILAYIESASNHISNIEAYDEKLIEAQKFLRNLQESLDMTIDLSKDLMALYIFCNKQIIDARIKKDASYLDVVIKVLANLRDGFQEIAKHDTSSTMANTEQIYAGLTYGKNSLNETTLYSEERGFKI